MSEKNKITCPICGNKNESGTEECKICSSDLTVVEKEDLTILNALQQISGVGKSRAKKIVKSGMSDIKKLEEADIESFLSVEGIGKNTAEDILTTLEESKKEDGSLYLCGECGAFVGADSNKCSNCGMVMEEEEEEEEEFSGESMIEEEIIEEEDKGSLYLCSNCGSFISSEASECPYCGFGLEDDEYDEEEEEFIESEQPVVDESDKGLFLCTNCGSFVSSEAEKCSVCGFFFDEEGELEEEREISDEDVKRDIEEQLKETSEDDLSLEVEEGFSEISDEEVTRDIEEHLREIDEQDGVLEGEEGTKEIVDFDEYLDEEEPFEEVKPEGINAEDSEKMWFDDEEIEVDDLDLEELDKEIEMVLEKEYGISAKTIQALSLGSDLKMCGNCGGITEDSSGICSVCGYTFSEGKVSEESSLDKKEEWDLEKSSDALTKAFGLSSVPEENADKDEDEKGLDMCGVCGAFKTQDSERCPICGSLSSEAPEVGLDEMEIEEIKKSKDVFICDACGSFVEEGQEKCSLCNSNLELAMRKVKDIKLESDEHDTDHSEILSRLFDTKEISTQDEPQDEITTCKNCGALLPSESHECYICSTSLKEETTTDDLKIDPDLLDIEQDLIYTQKDSEIFDEEDTLGDLQEDESSLDDLSDKELDEIADITDTEEDIELQMEESIEPELESEVTDKDLVDLLKNVEKATVEDSRFVPSKDQELDDNSVLTGEESLTEEDFDVDLILKEINENIKTETESEVIKEDIAKKETEWEKCPSCDSYMSVESHGCGVCGYNSEISDVGTGIGDEETKWLDDFLGEDTSERGFAEKSKAPTVSQSGGIFGDFISKVSEFEVLLSSLSLFAFGGIYLYTYGNDGIVPLSLGFAILATLGIFLGLAVLTILNWKDTLLKSSPYSLYGYFFGLILASIVPINHYILRNGLPLVINAGLISVSLGIIWVIDSQMDKKIREYMMWFTGITVLFLVSFLVIQYRALSLDEMGYPTLMTISFGSLLVIGSTVTWYKNADSENDVFKNIEVGHRHLISGDHEDALVAYERAIQKSTKSFENVEKDLEYPLYSKGLAFCSMGNYEEAVETFKKVLEIAPNSLATWNNLGTAYSRMGEQKLAIKCLKRALEIDDNYEVFWNNLGNAMFRVEQYSKALDCYDRALKINNRYNDANINKTQCLIKLGSGA